MNLEEAGTVPAERAGDALERILARQRQACQAAGAPGLPQRRADLARLRRLIAAREARIVETIEQDFGCRSRQQIRISEILLPLAGLRHAERHLARWMRPRRVSVGLELLPGRAEIRSQPLGVVGIISPWNYPFQLAVMPLIAALAAGNRVMLKPSELTPGTARLLAELLAEAFPPEQVAVVEGGPEVGAAFSALAFDHLFFTGSTAVGRKVMQAAAANLTPVTLELGGKSPAILGEDADLAQAVESLVQGKLFNAGQTCVAPDYVLVPEARRDAFVAAARRTVARLYPTLRDNPDYTNLIDRRHRDRLKAALDAAQAQGATLVELNPAGERFLDTDRKLPPTLVLDPPRDGVLMAEELFGPVLPVVTYRSLDEVLDGLAGLPRPLALYYFGRDRAAAERVLGRTLSGGATINDTMLHVGVEALPFGGVGASGMGAYHGIDGFNTFSHRRGVFMQRRPNGGFVLRPPYGWLKRRLLGLLIGRYR